MTIPTHHFLLRGIKRSIKPFYDQCIARKSQSDLPWPKCIVVKWPVFQQQLPVDLSMNAVIIGVASISVCIKVIGSFQKT